ncbi:phosphoribosylaminoimidazolesuccinocarboxamide synthase [candidate division KSB1 bacterium]|nr:MAG: phosphoribosylaminoimidazolesuccinocarboxamide synthase [candidate division KSB1 bacterium]
MDKATLLQTYLPSVSLKARGKVRDIYDLGEHLLLVATDRLSAFDVILPFWFQQMSDIIPHHAMSVNVDDYPTACRPYREQLEGRSMLVHKTQPLPIECVVRGYLAGSAWNEYQNTGAICGIKLPGGLIESSKLDQPIFTPATKAEMGQHDENIAFDRVATLVGREYADRLRDISIAVYRRAQALAESKGIIIADTKMEFGMKDGKLILIDELLTPDSSRFWPMASYKPGGSQPSFDKQFVRDYLISIQWNKQPPAPDLPDDVVQTTSQKYLEAYERLTGSKLNVQN